MLCNVDDRIASDFKDKATNEVRVDIGKRFTPSGIHVAVYHLALIVFKAVTVGVSAWVFQ